MLIPAMTLRLVRTLYQIHSILKQSGKIYLNYPSLFLFGEKDVITPMKETHKLLKKLQFKDLTIR